ncbi:MAG: GNAT family N-acetyltransferase [Alphaproteobacteria bacterium]|nr:GNAT family N-acetyltransferase [Alphaproteobacteria bacterium]MCB9792293.1 GNAT family N-acetyltransferase [Alphaproteobacteria bacterium]
MNAAAVPATSELDLPALEALYAQSMRLSVVTDAADRPLGFMLTLGPGQPYASQNYLWFSQRYADFAYVDRVVVDAPWRNQGLGAALYADLDAHAPPGAPILCEVNLEPPNPASLRFHARLGFREVGQQDTEGGKKRVSMLEWAR